MSKFKKWFWVVLLVVLIAIQFFGPAKPGVSANNPDDLLVTAEVPEDISLILQQACYDCHSMETKFPFYSRVAPVSWYINNHIVHGRDELNFSAWNTYDKRTRIKHLGKIKEEVEEGKMPLSSYTWLHGDARLSDEQVARLIAWSEEMARKVFSGEG